ncbi:phage tail tube protein [Acetobacter persici]|uniref:phage tail tube protein n=1 Tax=Acetobacter persici TaxID=1076596 RepID=UPI0020CC91CB|nr:phage tail tube protein [Acetobacter persici]MCP9320104.1 phage tail tube protein [Acetobacter persici]
MAANPGDVIGIVAIYLGTRQLDCVQGSNIRLSGRKNTAVTTGYRTRTAASYQNGEVNATVVLGTGDDLDWPDPSSRGPLQVRCDTGQVVAIQDGILEQKPQISDNGGKAPLRWFFDNYTIQATS